MYPDELCSELHTCTVHVTHLHVHVDVILPFGLRSAPKTFSTVADTLMLLIMH